MFFTRKVRAIYDDAIARLDSDRASGLRAIDDRITSEVARLEDRIGAVLAEFKRETDATEYPEPKRVTENDEAAAQKESA
jgi:hypothetical protein